MKYLEIIIFQVNQSACHKLGNICDTCRTPNILFLHDIFQSSPLFKRCTSIGGEKSSPNDGQFSVSFSPLGQKVFCPLDIGLSLTAFKPYLARIIALNLALNLDVVWVWEKNFKKVINLSLFAALNNNTKNICSEVKQYKVFGRLVPLNFYSIAFKIVIPKILFLKNITIKYYYTRAFFFHVHTPLHRAHSIYHPFRRVWLAADFSVIQIQKQWQQLRD